MRRISRRSSSSPRRKFDVSDFQLSDNFQLDAPGEDFVLGWIRVPADAYDTAANYQVPNNSTLIKTRVSLQCMVRSDTDLGANTMFFDTGIIAWPGFEGETIPTDFPDPAAPWPWIWRHRQTVPILGASTSFLPNFYSFDNLFGPESNVSSQAQRKLPEGMGILLVARWTIPSAGNSYTRWLGVRGTMWLKLA